MDGLRPGVNTVIKLRKTIRTANVEVLIGRRFRERSAVLLLEVFLMCCMFLLNVPDPKGTNHNLFTVTSVSRKMRRRISSLTAGNTGIVANRVSLSLMVFESYKKGIPDFPPQVGGL